jgi:asparagine synthase (glutamine-hydrolysing)
MEFAASLPENMRVRRGQGKYLMKHTMERYLPKDILYRPKMGFVTPIVDWLRGPLVDAARDVAHSAHLAQLDWFDSAAVAKVAEDHIAGRFDNGRLLWQLIMLDKSIGRIFG